MTSRFWLSALLLGTLCSLACGGSLSDETNVTSAGAGASGVAGQAGQAASAGTGGLAGGDVTGSFQLTFTQVKQDKKILGLGSPSEGQGMRLDVRATASGYEALLTSSFGDPSPMTVQVSPTEVTLDGSATLGSGSDVSDSWTHLVLARSPSGGFAGPAQAEGQETVFQGDVGQSTGLHGEATVGGDQVPPQFSVQAVGAHAPDMILPWSRLSLRASEGVDGGALDASLRMLASGKTLERSWQAKPEPTAPNGWAGAVRGELRLVDWSVGGAVELRSMENIYDPSGNAATPLSRTLAVQPVPGPQVAHTFDGDVMTYAGWGVITELGGASGKDPECEQGGCAQLGPLKVGSCSQDQACLVVRVKTAGKSQIAVRYRVRAAQQTSPRALGVRVVTRSGAQASAVEDAVRVEDGSDSVTPFVSAWSTLALPLPAGAGDEVGVEVCAQTDPACGFVPPGALARVLVDRIEAK